MDIRQMPTKTEHPFVIADALIGAHAANNRVASMVAHRHNVRRMWLKAVGVTELPKKLDPHTVSRPQAMQALEESWKAIESTLRLSLNGAGRIKGFKPDAASFLAYLVAHDAHHRGRITMMARWEWGTR